MAINQIEVSRKAILNALDPDFLKTARRPCCDDYHSVYYKLSAGTANQDVAAAFKLLGAATSMRLMPDDVVPFDSMYECNGSRSPILDDFSNSEIQLFNSVLSEVGDYDIKARLADIIWARQKEYGAAQVAVSSYLLSISKLYSEAVHHGAELNRIDRVVVIARSLGQAHSACGEVRKLLELIMQKAPLDFFKARIVQAIMRLDNTEADALASMCQNFAAQAASNSNFLLAREFWELAAKWHAIRKQELDRRSALIEAAETYVKEAAQALQREPPSYAVAGTFIGNAIEALRSISDTKPRREELHRTLLEYQKKSTDELMSVTSEIDVGEIIPRSLSLINGKSLHESIQIFANSHKSPSVARLRKWIKIQSSKFPEIFLFPSVIVDERGKVVSRGAGYDLAGKNESEAAFQHQMFRQVQTHRLVAHLGYIDPIRSEIDNRHDIRIDDFLPFVHHNCFVPADRESLYAYGFYLGMRGRLIEAVHILLPQLENSFRFILEQRGVITSGFDQDGIQDDYNLNKVLYLPQMNGILDEDTLFDLRGLLIEKAGTNLRNLIAHGLASTDMLLGVPSAYVWWLTLRLCVLFKEATVVRGAKNTSGDIPDEPASPAGV